MTPDQRWLEIDRELADLWQGKFVPGDPVACKSEFLAEQDRLARDEPVTAARRPRSARPVRKGCSDSECLRRQIAT
jgi:hypothetical protein